MWCGTSVGAINATMLASLAHLPAGAQVDQAAANWRELRKRDVISPIAGRGGLRMLTRAVGHALGVPGVWLSSLLDPSPLQASLERWVDWSMLRRNVQRGVIDAVCVIATSLATGDPVGFVSTRRQLPRHLDDGLRYVSAQLGSEHVRASAAIPILFPTVEVTTPRSASGHYIDGGTRLNSPIKPALHFGAEKVIVVGLEPFAAAVGRASSMRRPGIADVRPTSSTACSSTRSPTTSDDWPRSTRSSPRATAPAR